MFGSDDLEAIEAAIQPDTQILYYEAIINQVEQTAKRHDDALREGAIDDARWLRVPEPNYDVVIAYQRAVTAEAIKAAGIIGVRRRDFCVRAVTFADRLNVGWTASQHARSRGAAKAQSHIEGLMVGLPRNCQIVTAIDRHPATPAWLGGVAGHKPISDEVEHFGQDCTIGDLYRH